jgi:hypothetical protein
MLLGGKVTTHMRKVTTSWAIQITKQNLYHLVSFHSVKQTKFYTILYSLTNRQIGPYHPGSSYQMNHLI